MKDEISEKYTLVIVYMNNIHKSRPKKKIIINTNDLNNGKGFNAVQY